MKKKLFKILNIIEPILCILFVISLIYTIGIALRNIDWLAGVYGKSARQEIETTILWYEELIAYVTFVLPIIIIVIELYIFFKIKNKYKLYTIIYLVVDIIAFFISSQFAYGIFISLVLFNLIKCTYRIKNEKKILK